MNNTIKLFVLLFFTLPCFFVCEEKIPEGPPKVQVIEAELYVPFDRKIFPQPTNFNNRYFRPENYASDDWSYATDADIRFRIKVNNTFDETIDGLKWIDAKLHLWSTNYLDINYHLNYRNFEEDSSLIVLHPGKTYYVYTKDSLIWRQEDETGESIHKQNPYRMFFIRPDSSYDKQSNRWEYFCDTTYTAWVDTVVNYDLPIKMKAQAEIKIFKNYEAITTNVYHFEIHYFYPEGMTDLYVCPYGGGF